MVGRPEPLLRDVIYSSTIIKMLAYYDFWNGNAVPGIIGIPSVILVVTYSVMIHNNMRTCGCSCSNAYSIGVGTYILCLKMVQVSHYFCCDPIDRINLRPILTPQP